MAWRCQQCRCTNWATRTTCRGCKAQRPAWQAPRTSKPQQQQPKKWKQKGIWEAFCGRGGQEPGPASVQAGCVACQGQVLR
eukprot:4657966-Alexandrium_andersonii.AAC.1